MPYARAVSIVGSLFALLKNRLGVGVDSPLGSQEISCVRAPDRRLVVLGHEPIAGYARDFGEVANEAAMLALHTFDSATLIAEPAFVAPGDSCTRADDPGWRWHCISGHGLTLADWERRPLAGALEGFADTEHTHAIADVSGLVDALAAKQATLTNAATLAKIGEAAGLPRWNGAEWPGGGTGSSSLWDLPAVQHWYGPGQAPCGTAGPCTDGQAIASWHDSGRRNRTMVQATAGSRPTYVASLRNGYGGILTANSTSQRLSAATDTYTSGLIGNFSLWIAAKRGATSGTLYYAGSTDTGRISLYWEAGSYAVVLQGTAITFPHAATTDFELIKVTLRGTTCGVSVNGVALVPSSTAPVPAGGAWTLSLGAYYSTQGCDLTIGSYILADGSLTSTQEAQIDGYLATLWGL